MDASAFHRRWGLLAALALSLTATGCQVDVGGQTLPSPWYLEDDVQYFPTGPEFKLSNEAAAMERMQRGAVLQGAPPSMPVPMAPAPAPAGVVPPPGGEAVPPPAAPQM